MRVWQPGGRDYEVSRRSSHFPGRAEPLNGSQPDGTETLHHAAHYNALEEPPLHIQMRHVFSTQHYLCTKYSVNRLFSVFQSPGNHWIRLVSTQPHCHRQHYLYIKPQPSSAARFARQVITVPVEAKLACIQRHASALLLYSRLPQLRFSSTKTRKKQINDPIILHFSPHI